jgi:hypothetical protein
MLKILIEDQLNVVKTSLPVVLCGAAIHRPDAADHTLALPLLLIVQPYCYLNLKQLLLCHGSSTTNSRALRRKHYLLSSHMLRVNHSIRHEVPTIQII